MSRKTTELAWKIWEDWCAKIDQKELKESKARRSNKREIKGADKLTFHHEQQLLKALKIMMKNEINEPFDERSWYKWESRTRY